MLRNLNDLANYALHATDGMIGHVKDFYFDDKGLGVIRYLVVDAGTWLSSRKVLISPIALGKPNWAEKAIPVSISKQQIKDSPDIGTEKPVSRQHELAIRWTNHGTPDHWGDIGLWGGGRYPGICSCPAMTGWPRRHGPLLREAGSPVLDRKAPTTHMTIRICAVARP